MTSALAVRTAIINARMVASDNFQFKLMFCMHSFHLPVNRKSFCDSRSIFSCTSIECKPIVPRKALHVLKWSRPEARSQPPLYYRSFSSWQGSKLRIMNLQFQVLPATSLNE
jgi:hypothetical protein